MNMRSLIDLFCQRLDEFGDPHGEYQTRCGDLLNQGRGCPQCANVNRVKAQLKYTHDKHFFETPNLLNSYWAGFIAADGCISERRGILTISLKNADRGHLVKFCEAIQYDGIIYYEDDRLGDKIFPKAIVVISGARRIIRDLQANYLITPRKSMSLVPPIHLSRENQLAYLKGYLDGDGHIRSDGPRYRVGACGTQKSLEWIKTWFDQISEPVGGTIAKVRTQGNIYVYEVGFGRAERILSHLRTIGTPHLRRKWGHD